MLVMSAYLSAVLFAAIFLFVGQGISSQLCLGNYVIFTIAPWATWPYAIYYYSWLMIGTYYAWIASENMRERSKRYALRWLAVGYLAFIIPTTAANIINPETIAGIPSIMCGFAILLAIILTVSVLPNFFAKDNSKRRKKRSRK